MRFSFSVQDLIGELGESSIRDLTNGRDSQGGVQSPGERARQLQEERSKWCLWRNFPSTVWHWGLISATTTVIADTLSEGSSDGSREERRNDYSQAQT